MSIPPLVCSTPPPPEQCEEDKDHEDFDLPYNLSQEDDDDSTEYNYGNFSGYNIYPPKPDQNEKNNWSPNLYEEAQKITHERTTDGNLIPKDISKFDDNILEDLNLKVVSDNVHSNNIPSEEHETDIDKYNNEQPEKSSMIQDQGGTNIAEIIIDPIKTYDSHLGNINDIQDCENNETFENTEDSSEDLSDIILEEKVITVKSEQYVVTGTMVSESNQQIVENVDQSKKENLTIDDFEDFDDFQFTQSNTSQVLPMTSENPWEHNAHENIEFGDFRANFEDLNIKKSSDVPSINQKDSTVEDLDDDFGEFDDFKSVNNVENIEENNDTVTNNVPVFHFHSPENESQIVDSINSVLTSIFTYEISEPESDLDGKLELFLNETWGHLVDIDIRQPYIINWNNSMGQKTLLKALCIDSRNILFGPKWSYNTPKYATNLSAAPLQPQKQLNQPNSFNTESTETTANKETGTWVDPFTPDGQESCSTENDKKINITNRPTDLDVFENESSSKLNKVYSSTINVQPLRHINLPDTHIFTPTDSETPRSKTIHYDNGPPSLIPQTVIESAASQPEQQVSQPTESDSEYWEFQDFKGKITDVQTNTSNKIIEQSNNVTDTVSNDTPVKTGITYQTQILKPIKLEPIMPTLNWPDPGEVKETFEDFSDFVSSNSWSEKDLPSEKDIRIVKTKPKDYSLAPVVDKIEDEFESFQSAPNSSSALDVATTSISPKNLSSNNFTPQIKEKYENVPIEKEIDSLKGANVPIIENKISVKTDNISLQDSAFSKSYTSAVSQTQLNNEILLPINSSTNASIRNQHNSTQILQPLSLESYSQINWPNPGIDLQDLSRFNPMNSLNSLKSDVSAGNSKIASPVHHNVNTVHPEVSDDDIWGEFVSSIPKTQQTSPKKNVTFAEDDEWTDFVSSPSIKPPNGLNTISLNVHTNSNIQKTTSQSKFASGSNQIQLDIPTLNYITPKSNSRALYMEKHFQNL